MTHTIEKGGDTMRASGILLPVFSLPSEGKIGNFSEEARHFIDFLAEAGQKYWQILPLGPEGQGNSPYQPVSCFAGSLCYLDPKQLMEQGFLTEQEVLQYQRHQTQTAAADYAAVRAELTPLLDKAYFRFKNQPAEKQKEFREFCAQHAFWLDDYALFTVISEEYPQMNWRDWPDPLRYRDPDALREQEENNQEQIACLKWIQFQFLKQWTALREYAHEKGIRIIGDMPIYTSMEGADSWAYPEIFQYDEELNAASVSGCPPDAFAKEGQLWGNPLYRWHSGRKAVYHWWLMRIRQQFHLFDIVRLDHFRGFQAYYAIPADADSAMDGHWEKGPGRLFFQYLKHHHCPQNFIAENLGFLTDEVQKLIDDTGFPGMKVLQFAFDFDYKNQYLPEHYEPNCIVYTGTHDNDTTRGWFEQLDVWHRGFIANYINDWFRKNYPGEINTENANAAVMNHNISHYLIQTAMASRADTCIIPLQDWLNLDSSARVNTPSTVGGNWSWRMDGDAFQRALDQGLAGKIRDMCEKYGRIPKPEASSFPRP